MELKNVESLIKKFRGYVIQQSRSNLTRGGKNASSKLYNSIKSEVLTEDGYNLINFSMEDYGAYQDLGVRGKNSNAKAPSSPFKFGSGKGESGGLTEGINKWVKLKGIQFRDKETGRFISYNSTAFLIIRSIYQTGIKPSLFFTKPFEVAKKRYLGKELIKAYKADIEAIVSFNLKEK